MADRSRELRCPPNATLISLSPYSPELNPVESLWHYLRSHHWSNRTYTAVDDLYEAAQSVWQASCLTPNRIQTVCRAEYIQKRG